MIAIAGNLSTRTTKPPNSIRAGASSPPRPHASGLNQVEIFFSILAKRLLRHGTFASEQNFATQMLASVEHYNLTAKPFQLTYAGKGACRMSRVTWRTDR